MNIVMLLSNPFRPDPRVLKESESLSSAGYHVTVICWDREAEFPSYQAVGGIEIRRIHSVRTTYGAGARQLLKIPRFWNEAVRMAVDLHPDAIHCHDLDTLLAGVRLKRQLRCRLIFDAHEDYPALMSLYLPKGMVFMLRFFERILLRHADLILTASTVYAKELVSRGLTNILPLPNVDNLEVYESVTANQVTERRNWLKLREDEFAVAYIGGFSRNRELLAFIQTAALLPRVRFFLWGDGHQRQAITNAVQGLDNIQYQGWLPAEQIPITMKAVDAIYYCLREDYPGAVYNAPNTLSHAMAAGRPIIANEVGDLGLIIKRSGCGLLINPVTPDTISQALLKLGDPELRYQLGNAGFNYAKDYYNWNIISGILIARYIELIPPKY